MARTNNLTNFLTDVAGAIKQKTGDNSPIVASDFDTIIGDIETGGNYQTKSLNVTEDGDYDVTPDSEYDAINQLNLTVNVTPPEYETDLYLSNQILDQSTGYEIAKGLRNNGQTIIRMTASYDSPVTIDVKGRMNYSGKHNSYGCRVYSKSSYSSSAVRDWVVMLAFNNNAIFTRSITEDNDYSWSSGSTTFQSDTRVIYNTSMNDCSIDGTNGYPVDGKHVPDLDLSEVQWFGPYDTSLTDNGWTIYYTKVYDKYSKKLIYDFLPARQISTNKIGIWKLSYVENEPSTFYEVPDNNYTLITS